MFNYRRSEYGYKPNISDGASTEILLDRIDRLKKRIDEIIEYLDVEYSKPQPSKLVPKSKSKNKKV